MAEQDFPELSSQSNIVVVGTSGSGKTTLAKKLCELFKLQEVELDALFWEPGWTEADQEVFRSRIDQKTSASGWAVSGNYRKVRDLTWDRADTVIWLDYSRAVVMTRVFKRTIQRLLKKEVLWGGNRETLYKSFMSRDSIILWAWNSHSKNKARYEADFHSGDYRGMHLLRLKSHKECHEFVLSLSESR